MDFKKYDNLLEIKDYDGFISPDGYFYKVKKKQDSIIDHNLWASKFLEKCGKGIKLQLDTNSLLFQLSKFSGESSDILVHLYGYIYYSHDGIVRLPNPQLFGNRATDKSLDLLLNLFNINNEKEAMEAIFDHHKLSYIALDEQQAIYSKGVKL